MSTENHFQYQKIKKAWSHWEGGNPNLPLHSPIFLKLGKKNTFSGAQPEIFQGRGGFVELGHFNKYFVKNMEKLNRAFLPKSENFFQFPKKGRDTSLTLVARCFSYL